MSTKSPIFPMPEPHHFSDYGFDPQIDYFQQVLEEARRHKRETRSIDAIHFKLQKPNSKDDLKKFKKRRWWRNALLFWKWKWVEEERPRHHYLPKPRGAVSGPVYGGVLETGSRSRPSSGPLAGTMSPRGKGEVDAPYFSLRELNLEHRMSTSALPIYLVT
ncbi:hypothetical protein AAC387_Pa03g2015 [Persea americana]